MPELYVSVETASRGQTSKDVSMLHEASDPNSQRRTPDLQLLINPALNPHANVVWPGGLRARLAL